MAVPCTEVQDPAASPGAALPFVNDISYATSVEKEVL